LVGEEVRAARKTPVSEGENGKPIDCRRDFDMRNRSGKKTDAMK
jgi:hypothetical protein